MPWVMEERLPFFCIPDAVAKDVTASDPNTVSTKFHRKDRIKTLSERKRELKYARSQEVLQ